MNYQQILDEIYKEAKVFKGQGELASYIPELARVDPLKYGIHLATIEGAEFAVGDSQEPFSIQSISKVLSLALVLPLIGEMLWERVGVEPSGNPFNSIVQLEYENGIPRNPFLNAGALVMADILISRFDDPKREFLQFVRRLAGNETIQYDEEVAASEKATGYVNASLINMMKSYGNINNEIDSVLDFYYHQCSIAMSCQDLARAFLVFADEGCIYGEDTRILKKAQVKRINALMQTCGFYDEAGEFSFRVGLPGKSGVGGGIVAVHPKCYSVAVWSPKLNKKGNSVLGMKTLELLTTKSGTSIF
ncbi:glutaminase [Cesiribacter andamanensis]|uniref:Glutaminase n=1 Tax=Cesiribacter andamanensis AMV16 TaxID=1279009 RepID=M7NH33_9BACT|nr:glutaminase [Cesiribacter andamanensis]EMR01135.1 Thermolabile glutaminase [Cesiribacter andamanensis AMV16]